MDFAPGLNLGNSLYNQFRSLFNHLGGPLKCLVMLVKVEGPAVKEKFARVTRALPVTAHGNLPHTVIFFYEDPDTAVKDEGEARDFGDFGGLVTAGNLLFNKGPLDFLLDECAGRYAVLAIKSFMFHKFCD